MNKSRIVINQNISSKTFLLITIFSFLLFAFFLTNLIINIINTKNYVKVDAVITKVDYHLLSPDQTVSYYIEFNYNYDNNNYTNERKVDVIFNKKVGKKIKIYVNPQNPSIIKDTYISNTLIILTIFTLIFFIFSVRVYNLKKVNSNR